MGQHAIPDKTTDGGTFLPMVDEQAFYVIGFDVVKKIQRVDCRIF